MFPRLFGHALLTAGLVLAGCGAQTSEPTDTNTSWLSPCDSDRECGEALECVCNVCTIACSRDADCSGHSAPASCEAAPDTCAEGVNLCLPEAREGGDGGSQRPNEEIDAGSGPEPSASSVPSAPAPNPPTPSPSLPRVCEGFYYVQTQAELDALAGCTEITEGLNVGFDADLEPLSELRTVGGWLRIGNDEDPTQTAVTSLQGLRSLEDAYGIMLENFGGGDLAGLENLRTLGGDASIDGGLQIMGAPYLQELTGIDSLQRVSLLLLSGLPQLESLDGLESLAELAHVSLRALPALRSTRGLSVTELEVFEIHDCASLEVIEAPGLERLSLFIAEANASLSSLPVLAQLQSCNECSISRNPALEVLSLPLVQQANNYLRVLENDALSRLELPLLQTVGELTFVHNSSLPTSVIDDLAEQVEVTRFTKVGGNEGDTVPPRDPCPWTTDYVCDEPLGTGLCALDTDADCDVVPL